MKHCDWAVTGGSPASRPEAWKVLRDNRRVALATGSDLKR